MIHNKMSSVLFQPEKNTKVAVMHHKCHSYLPGSPATTQVERLVEHRNSSPAIHLKTEVTSDSLTSLTPRARTRSEPGRATSQHRQTQTTGRRDPTSTTSTRMTGSTYTKRKSPVFNVSIIIM